MEAIQVVWEIHRSEEEQRQRLTPLLPDIPPLPCALGVLQRRPGLQALDTQLKGLLEIHLPGVRREP